MTEERNALPDGSQSQLSNIGYEYDCLGNLTKKLRRTDVNLPAYDRWSILEYDEVTRLIRRSYSWSASDVRFSVGMSFFSPFEIHNDLGDYAFLYSAPRWPGGKSPPRRERSHYRQAAERLRLTPIGRDAGPAVFPGRTIVF